MIHDKTGLSEEAVREDLSAYLKNKDKGLGTRELGIRGLGNASNSRVTTPNPYNLAPSPSSPSNFPRVRLDIIMRKLFGLLAFIEKNQDKIHLDPNKYLNKSNK